MDVTLDDSKLRKYMTELSRSLTDMEPIMDTVGSKLVALIQDNLRQGLTPWGEKFVPLSTTTKLVRFREGKKYTKKGATTARFFRHMTGNHVPLNDTGQHILNKITHKADKDSVIVGMKDSESNKIGRTHQFGATIVPKLKKTLMFEVNGEKVFVKKVTIPARPFMPIRKGIGTSEGKVDIPDAWHDSIVENIRELLADKLR